MASLAAPSLRDQALHLLQEAALADRETKLVLLNSFHQILRRDSSLLPVLFTSALDFAADRLADARKWAAAFAEEAMLSTLPEDLRVAFLSQSLDRLARLISDDSVAVVKRTVICLANIYPFTFQRIATHPENSNLWDGLVMLKTKALQLLQSSDNEGIKTAVTKFMQVIILVQSRGQDGDVSIRLCKPGHPVLQSVTLEEEGNATLEALMALIHAELLSSSTITAIISAIGPMLKTRVQHLHRVLYVFRNWTKNSPRTLTATQTKSIERTIKNQLTALLKSTALSAHAPTILEALGDISPETAAMLSRQLGRSYQQQRPSDPSVDDKRRKRPADMDNSNNNLSIDSNSKRPKVADIIQSTIRAPAPPNVPAPSSVGIHPPFNPPTDVTKIPLPAVVEVVLRTLMSVPVEMLNMAILHHRNNPAFIAALMGQPSSGPLTSTPDRTGREGGTFLDDAAATVPTSQPGYPPLSSTASDLLSQMLPGLKPLNQTGPPSMSNASASAPVPATATTANAFRIKKVFLKPATPLSPSSCRNLAASTIRRVIQAGGALGNAAAVVRARADSVPQTPTVQPNSAPKSVHPSTAGLGAAKDGWMVVLSRLMTRAGAVDGVDRRGTRSSAPASSAATPSGEVKVKQEEDYGNGTLDNEMCEQELIPHDGPCADDYREAMVEYIQEDFKNRHELAVVWLYEELYQDMKAFKETMTATPRYFRWLLRILDAVMPRTESKDRTFIKFLLDVPALDDAAVNRIRRYCDDPDSLLLGLSALRDLVLFRPPVRDMGLDVILSYCLNKRKVTRSTAIVTVKKWVPDHLEISERVEQFALQSLRRLQGPPEEPPADAVVDDVKQEETKDEKVGAAEWNELDVIRNLELFFALCTKKHELLGELFAVYPSTSQTVQRSVRKFVYPLIKSIGQGSTKLIHVIQEFPEGAEMLALRVLSIFTETARPSPQLVSVVGELFVRRNLHARFLIPIVAGLKKEEILKYLPRLVGLLDNTENERKVVKDVFLRLIDNPDVSSTPNNQPPTSAGTPPASDKAPSAAPLSPAELMVALHNMEETVGLKRAVEATQICFGLPEIFKAEVLAVVLQQMVDQPKLPTLFMRTVIQSVNLHKSLAGFVNGLLSRLITKKVWTAPKLWEGFMRCCRVTAPGSFTVLLQLPKPQLSEVLAKVPSLCKPLAEHVQNLPAPQRERIQNSVPVLKPVAGIKIETESSMGDRSFGLAFKKFRSFYEEMFHFLSFVGGVGVRRGSRFGVAKIV